MTQKKLGAAVAAVAALAVAVPTQAQTQAPQSDTYYFKCSGPSKVQNGIAALQPVTWGTTPPTASFQAGAGCGFADVPAPNGVRPSTTPENFYDAWYKGIHERAVGSARIELHNLVTSRARTGDSVSLLVRLSTGTGTTATTLHQEAFTVKPTVSSTGATEKVVVELKNLEIPAEAGRTINITIHTAGETPQAWVHDASEIPAGVTFTGPVPATA
jgi:hypothetical protein